jgi:hypothetical protein
MTTSQVKPSTVQMYSFTVEHGEKGKEHTTLHHVFAVTPKKAHATMVERYRGVPRVTITQKHLVGPQSRERNNNVKTFLEK